MAFLCPERGRNPEACGFSCSFCEDQPGHALPRFAKQDGLSGRQERPRGPWSSFLNRASQVYSQAALAPLAGAPGVPGTYEIQDNAQRRQGPYGAVRERRNLGTIGSLPPLEARVRTRAPEALHRSVSGVPAPIRRVLSPPASR
jgi:hypothetical protein